MDRHCREPIMQALKQGFNSILLLGIALLLTRCASEPSKVKPGSECSATRYNDRQIVSELSKWTNGLDINSSLSSLAKHIPPRGCEHQVTKKTWNKVAISIDKQVKSFPYPITDFITRYSYIYKRVSVPYLYIVKGNRFHPEDFIHSDLPTVFYLSAKWCTACKTLKPFLMQYLQLKKNFLVREVDIIDFDTEAAERMFQIAKDSSRYNIYLPYLIVYQNKQLMYLGKIEDFINSDPL